MGEKPVGFPQNKIPGAVQLKEQHAKNVKLLTYTELLDMKQRQSNLLKLKQSLLKLPDKGKRLRDSYDKTLAEIKRRNDVDAATALLSELNIASKGKTKLNNLEWHGRLGSSADDSAHVDDILDSDDDMEMDPLRIIAQGTMHERQVKVLPPPATLITSADLEEIAAFERNGDTPDSAMAAESDTSSISSKSTTTSQTMPIIAADFIEIDAARLAKAQQHTEMDQHALYLIDKTELQVKAPSREKFLPFRTTTSNVHDPNKERARKQGKHWENTAATPPLIQHKEVQFVSLADSACLQVDFLQKIKELRVQQAEQRLPKPDAVTKMRLPDESVLKTKSSFTTYRNPNVNYLIEGRQAPGEMENEVHDPAITDKVASGINYTVYN